MACVNIALVALYATGLRPLIPITTRSMFMASFISIAGDSDSNVAFFFAGVFADGRLVIAVTHFDEYYCHPDECPSEQEVKEVVSQMIKSAVDIHFSEEKVIPLCGLWAFNGRQLRCSPNDKDLKKKCLPFLEHCYQGPRGEDKEIPHLSSEEMAMTLETSSNVEALETQ